MATVAKRTITYNSSKKSILDRLGESTSLRWMLIVPAIILTSIGLVMVLSASSVESIASGVGPYNLFVKQALWALIGIISLTIVSSLPVSFIKKLAWPAIGIGIILLGMVAFTPLGVEVNGNKNWLDIGGFRMQPSEAVKLALCLWMGLIYYNKGTLVKDWKHAVIPVLFPVGGFLLFLVMYGRDLGTTIVLSLILITGMIVSGSNWKVLSITGLVGAAGAVISTVMSDNRMIRIKAWMGECGHPTEPCFQSDHGLHALASGGFFGVGLGQSRQKWSYVPEAENDFIFSILGEEMGFVGTIFVVLLFSMIALVLYVASKRAQDTFSRITLLTIMSWLVGQAVVNIAMVSGLLPVIGVPLPFISYGGSALLMSLLAIGVAFAIIREQENLTPFTFSVRKIKFNKKNDKKKESPKEIKKKRKVLTKSL